MNRMTTTPIIATFCLLIFVAGSTALAEGDNLRKYEITLTNLTKSQIFSPPLVVVHSPSTSLFEVGQPSSEELAMMAEDGSNEALYQMLMDADGVSGLARADGVLLPGHSLTLKVEASSDGRGVIHAVGMLVTTNDGFFSVAMPEIPRLVLLGAGGEPVRHARGDAYDAGSEANNESCAYIPGPPCGSGGARQPEGAEGFVHLHNGIHGHGDISPATYDWRSAVVSMTVRSTR